MLKVTNKIQHRSLTHFLNERKGKIRKEKRLGTFIMSQKKISGTYEKKLDFQKFNKMYEMVAYYT